jgi:tetratricopeptide (TPR) repeat protein
MEQTPAKEWFDKGVAFMNQNKYDEASQAFDKAIKINPQYVEAWAGKGWALYCGSKYSEARQAYSKTIELDPNYADAWTGNGFALLALGYSLDAIDIFNRAIALDPNCGLAWLGAFVLGYSIPSGPDKALKLNPRYAATLIDSRDYSKTLSFQRMVFLEEGHPRARLIASPVRTVPSPVASPVPQKNSS